MLLDYQQHIKYHRFFFSRRIINSTFTYILFVCDQHNSTNIIVSKYYYIGI